MSKRRLSASEWKKIKARLIRSSLADPPPLTDEIPEQSSHSCHLTNLSITMESSHEEDHGAEIDDMHKDFSKASDMGEEVESEKEGRKPPAVTNSADEIEEAQEDVHWESDTTSSEELPPLIIEREPVINKHDEDEHFYEELYKRMKIIYHKLFGDDLYFSDSNHTYISHSSESLDISTHHVVSTTEAQVHWEDEPMMTIPENQEILEDTGKVTNEIHEQSSHSGHLRNIILTMEPSHTENHGVEINNINQDLSEASDMDEAVESEKEETSNLGTEANQMRTKISISQDFRNHSDIINPSISRNYSHEELLERAELSEPIQEEQEIEREMITYRKKKTKKLPEFTQPLISSAEPLRDFTQPEEEPQRTSTQTLAGLFQSNFVSPESYVEPPKSPSPRMIEHMRTPRCQLFSEDRRDSLHFVQEIRKSKRRSILETPQIHQEKRSRRRERYESFRTSLAESADQTFDNLRTSTPRGLCQENLRSNKMPSIGEGRVRKRLKSPNTIKREWPTLIKKFFVGEPIIFRMGN